MTIEARGMSDAEIVRGLKRRISKTRKAAAIVKERIMAIQETLAEFCMDDRHETPCQLPCRGCEEDGCETGHDVRPVGQESANK